MRHITSNDLPEDIARRAEAMVATGRFESVEDVIRAGVENLAKSGDTAQEWLGYLRTEAAAGFAELDRGESISGTAEELMAAIRAEIGQR